MTDSEVRERLLEPSHQAAEAGRKKRPASSPLNGELLRYFDPGVLETDQVPSLSHDFPSPASINDSPDIRSKKPRQDTRITSCTLQDEVLTSRHIDNQMFGIPTESPLGEFGKEPVVTATTSARPDFSPTNFSIDPDFLSMQHRHSVLNASNANQQPGPFLGALAQGVQELEDHAAAYRSPDSQIRDPSTKSPHRVGGPYATPRDSPITHLDSIAVPIDPILHLLQQDFSIPDHEWQQAMVGAGEYTSPGRVIDGFMQGQAQNTSPGTGCPVGSWELFNIIGAPDDTTNLEDRLGSDTIDFQTNKASTSVSLLAQLSRDAPQRLGTAHTVIWISRIERTGTPTDIVAQCDTKRWYAGPRGLRR